MIRRLSNYFLWLALILALSGPAWGKYASIVVDYHTGHTVHEVNANTQNYPASLTKIMTLFMTFEALRDGKLKETQRLRVSYAAQRKPPSKLGLRKGQTIRVRDCIYALITKSANDAAVVLAEAMGGTERKFAKMMTRRARKLGMSRTTFRNASGLPDRDQLSTAEDMSVLARALLRTFPKQYRKFSRKKWKWKGRTYRNHNRLLSWYAGADGIKTGYIRASGFNLVASARRGDKRYIAVVFGGKSSRWRDRRVARLLDKGFASKTVQTASVKSKPKVAKRKAGAASSAKTARARSVAKTASKWAIQVGVYYNYSGAKRAFNIVTRSVPQLKDKPFDIVTQESRSRRHSKLYKARFQLPSSVTARSYCGKLKRSGLNCIVVSNNVKTASARPASRSATVPRKPQKTAARAAPAVQKKKRISSSRNLPARAPAGRVKSWAIQVGVYYAYADAKRAIMRAARSVPSLKRERYKITTQKSKHRRYNKLYKARLLVASRNSAKNYCRALERRRINCIVVRMG